MNTEQQEFILKNYRQLSIRQIAKQINLPRSEVSQFVRQIGEKPVLSGEFASKSKELLWVAGLFLLALFLRFLYLNLLKVTPFFEPLSNKLDDGVYDSIAQEISRGNWMADLPFSAYRIPLYPYFLGVLYYFFGHSIFIVHAIQSLLGSLTPILIYLISKKVFRNQRAALISGLLASCYVPFIFFENLLLGESLSISLNLGSLFLLLDLFTEGKKIIPRVLLSGFLLGLSALLRPNTLVVILFLSAALYFLVGIGVKRYVKGLALSLLFVAASFMAILPIAIKNYYLHKDFLPISAVGGVNFYMGNNPEADGKFHMVEGVGTSLDEMIKNSEAIAQQEIGRPLKPSEASSYWVRKTLGFISETPSSFIKLIFKKTAFFFNHYEFPDILDINFVSQFIPFLGWNPFGYGFVMLFAIYGIGLSYRRRDANVILLWSFIASYAVSVVLFFITSRYRLPAVPVLIIFSGLALSKLIQSFKLWKTSEFLRFGLIAVASSILIFWPVQTTNFGTNYNSLGIALKNKGQFEEAEKYYRKAIELAPSYPSPYYNMSLLMRAMGREEEAAAFLQQYESLKRG